MAIMTISRFEGSKGNEIARDIAERLGYALVDRDRIHEMAKAFKGDFATEIRVIENENKPGFFDFLFRQRSVYGHMISAIIYEAVASDRAVIVGRGGQFLLQGKNHVINTRFTASFDIRKHRVMESLNIGEAVAEDYLKTSDRTREDFIRYLYREEFIDSKWYDVVIDTGKIPASSVTNFLADELKRIDETTPMTDEDKVSYKNLALEKRVEIMMLKELNESNYIKVIVASEGHVTLSGFLASEAERSAALGLAQAVDGVTAVEDRIIVSEYPVRPWY